MSRLDRNDAAKLTLRFSNGNGFSLRFESYDLEDASENTQSIEVGGSTEKGDRGARFYCEPFSDDEEPSDECGFSSTVISRLINVNSVANLIRVVSDLYYISTEGAETSQRAIADSIHQIITANMQTMDDLEEVTLTMASFTAYYRDFELVTPDQLIHELLGSDASFEIDELFDAIDEEDDNFIDELKNVEVLKNVSEESFSKIAYLYEEDALEDVNDYAVKQTWKKGGEINIDFAFFENPFFGIFEISDVDDLDDEDWQPDFTDDTIVEVKHGIPYIRWMEDDEEDEDEEEYE